MSIRKNNKVEISSDDKTRLAYLAASNNVKPHIMLKYLIQREFRRYVSLKRFYKEEDSFLLKIKDSPPVFFEIDTNGDIIHYIYFLKELYRVTREISISDLGLFYKIIEIETWYNKEKIRYIFMKYYPFESKIIKKPEKRNKIKTLREEIIKTGKEIQIMRERRDIPLQEIIRKPPVIYKTDEQIMEEVLSW